MKTRDKEIRDLVIKVRGYYDGIDERLTDALKEILRRLDKPDHIPGVRKKVEIDIVKIRALIEEIAHSPCLAYDGCDDKKCVCPRGIAQKALTLLRESCQTCGGSKIEYLGTDNQGFVVLATTRKHYAIPCPDCQSQEPAKPDECEHCGCYVDAEGHGHHSVADCPLMHQPAKLPQFKDIIGLYCDDEPAEKPVLEKLAEKVMAYNRERGGELSEKPDINEFTAKIKRQYGVRNRPSWKTIVGILDRLEAAIRPVKAAGYNENGFLAVGQELIDKDMEIQQLQAKFEAAEKETGKWKKLYKDENELATKLLQARSKLTKRAEKSEFKPRLNMAFPVEWIGQYRNGGCTDPCDMISGPCACGATHHFDEWIIKRKKLVQGKGWVNPEESQELRKRGIYADFKEYPFQLHIRAKTMPEYYVQLRALIPDDLLDRTKISQEPAEEITKRIKSLRMEVAIVRGRRAEAQRACQRKAEEIKQLTIQLEAAKCVNEMLKEKGIG